MGWESFISRHPILGYRNKSLDYFQIATNTDTVTLVPDINFANIFSMELHLLLVLQPESNPTRDRVGTSLSGTCPHGLVRLA